MGRKGQGCGGGAGRGAIERDGRKSDNVDTGHARRRLRARSGHARRRRGARRGRVGDGGAHLDGTSAGRGPANREGGAGLGREDGGGDAARHRVAGGERRGAGGGGASAADDGRDAARGGARAGSAARGRSHRGGRAKGRHGHGHGVRFAVPPEAIGETGAVTLPADQSASAEQRRRPTRISQKRILTGRRVEQCIPRR